jgi:hypothetical protein
VRWGIGGWAAARPASKWIARHYSPAEGRKYLSIGSADDLLGADGGDTLTFAQAQVRAADWFREIERCAGGVMQPITVAEAMEVYVTDYLARGGKAERDLQTTIKAHILPDLGGKEVASLTNPTLRAWHHRLAAAPARMRTSVKAKLANVRPPEDAEGRRARRSTANRVRTCSRRPCPSPIVMAGCRPMTHGAAPSRSPMSTRRASAT